MARSRDWEAYAASFGSKMEPNLTLNDEQWSLIADIFPELELSPDGGRPPAPSRACFEGSAVLLDAQKLHAGGPPASPLPQWK